MLLPGPQTWLRVLAAWWRRESNTALSKRNKEFMVWITPHHHHTSLCGKGTYPLPERYSTNTNVLLHRWENILNVYLKEGILVYKDKWFWNYADSYIIKQNSLKKKAFLDSWNGPRFFPAATYNTKERPQTTSKHKLHLLSRNYLQDWKK